MSEFNISIPGGETKRLLTGGKYCPADILVTAEGGGGSIGGGSELTKAIIERTITEYSDDTLETVGKYAFSSCTSLTTVDFPLVTSVGNYAFSGCTSLTTVDFPLVTSVGNYAFSSCTSLTTVDFPLVTSVGNSAFSGCVSLTTVDFPLVTSVGNSAFYACSKLAALALRNTDTVCTLSHTNAFNNTSIAKGRGYIYVPAALLEDYKAATNWSTYAAQFRALEDYTVDGTTTGALDPTKI